MTQTEFEVLRRKCKAQLKKAGSKMDFAKLQHQYTLVANAFNNARDLTKKLGGMKVPQTLKDLKANKYTPTVMALVSVCRDHDISLKRWCLAQARIITGTRIFTLYQCYGAKAFERYAYWESKEQKKALRLDEINRSTTSAYDVIRHSIISNHQDALRFIPVLKKIKPPTKASGLLYMFPQVSGWYMVAHKEFREELLDNGFCTEPNLLKLYKRYKNSENVRQICEETLKEAESQLGPLRW